MKEPILPYVHQGGVAKIFHLLIAQSVQKTIPTNIPIGKAAEAKITSLALAKPDFLPVKLAMKAIRKKPH